MPRMKIVVLMAFAGIIAALISAGVMMLRKRDGTGPDNRMARALAWRVGLSVALFAFILLAWSLGWVQPTGLPISTAK
jgi:NADH:ubiquinone oxidoreductase subunit 6 (subunit J)